MMQIVSTIRKLLTAYTVEQILGHFAHELDDCAAHFETVGAPRRAAYLRHEAEMLREVKAKIAQLPY